MRGSPSRRSSLTRRFVPRPPHVGHAPKGELNENWRGSSSGNEVPHVGQPYRSEKSSTVPVATFWTSTTPSASLSAVSIESVRRPRSSPRTASRSTTIEIV
jgi:hypothetical protein